MAPVMAFDTPSTPLATGKFLDTSRHRDTASRRHYSRISSRKRNGRGNLPLSLPNYHFSFRFQCENRHGSACTNLLQDTLSQHTDVGNNIPEIIRVFERESAHQVPEREKETHIFLEDSTGEDPDGKYGFDRLLKTGANIALLANLLDHCGKIRALHAGRRLHEYIDRYGYDDNIFLANCLIQMYGNCGSIEDARAAFEKIHSPNSHSWNILIKAYAQNENLQDARYVCARMPQRNVVSWTTLIGAFAQSGRGKEALEFYHEMQAEGIEPNKINFICVIDACEILSALDAGQEIHAAVVNGGFEKDLVVGTAIVSMYGKCGSLGDARAMFNKMVEWDVVSWSAMIAACAQNEHGKEALELLNQMQLEGVKPNKVTFVCALDACASLADIKEGQAVHSAIIKGGFWEEVIVGTALVNMYGKCGDMANARCVFCRMPEQNVVAWNAMIKSCCQNRHYQEALALFRQMPFKGIKPNKISFVCVLDACASLAFLQEGQDLHAAIVDSGFEPNVIIGNSLINMYGKCGSVDNVRSVFARMSEQDVVSWSAMITACSQNGCGKESLKLFHQMQLQGIKPNWITCISVLDACGSLGALVEGREMHATIIESMFELDLVVATALITMYGKCKSLDDAWIIFSRMPQWDIASWNAMIVACAQKGHVKEALELFHSMQCECIKPNVVTYLCVLDICASIAALKAGKDIHARIINSGVEANFTVCSSLVNMYGKCGSPENAGTMLRRMPLLNVVSWTAMITACAQNGNGKEALDLFDEMLASGIMPDNVSLVSLLAACSHTGCIDEGRHHFVSIERNHGITHTLNHYVCMIDLLGRAGHLNEAEDLIMNMPVEKAATAWCTLLGACKIHGDEDRAVRAAIHCFELDRKNAAPYVSLSNIHAAAGRWDAVMKVREMLKESCCEATARAPMHCGKQMVHLYTDGTI